MPVAKKTAYSALAHATESGVVVVPVGVWALDEAHRAVLEVADGAAKPIGLDVVVGVDDRDELGIGIGVRHRPVQRSRLGAGDALDMKEPEPVARVPCNEPRTGAIGAGRVVLLSITRTSKSG